MPRDPHKQQKALMKKRSKHKAALQSKARQEASVPSSLQAIIRRARAYPVLECWINANSQTDDLALVEILFSPQQPARDTCFGSYLVDRLCLGIKNTFHHT